MVSNGYLYMPTKFFKYHAVYVKTLLVILKSFKKQTSKPSPAHKHHGQFLARTQQSIHNVDNCGQFLARTQGVFP